MGHGCLTLGWQCEIGELEFATLGVRTDHVSLLGLQERQSLRTRTVRVHAHRDRCCRPAGDVELLEERDERVSSPKRWNFERSSKSTW